MVLASIKPGTGRGERYVADLLLEPTEKTRRLLDAPPQALSADTLAILRFFYGLAALRLGEQLGVSEWLVRAYDAFKSVLSAWTRERVPLDWAGTQNNLGNALATPFARRWRFLVLPGRHTLSAWQPETLPAPRRC